MAKGSKLKVRKFLGLIPTISEVTEENLVGEAFLPPHPLPSYIGLNEINRLSKQINSLLSKGMKLPFPEFKKFVSKSVFRKLQLTRISLNFQTFCCNLKIRVAGGKCEFLFYYSHFERNYNVLKSKNPCFLLNKSINVNKNETESKMENPTRTFR